MKINTTINRVKRVKKKWQTADNIYNDKDVSLINKIIESQTKSE